MIDVAIVGASGYGGGELMRWLGCHPQARVAAALSETYAGLPVASAFPGLAGVSDLKFSHPENFEAAAKCPVVFLAGESGFAMCKAKGLLDAGCKVVDLSADFRFRSADDYQAWYGIGHASPALSNSAVYGLPELHKATIQKAALVGNPGCYTTASILALAPLVSAELIDLTSIVIDGKSGVSGAGRSKSDLAFKFAEANESVCAYKAGGTHRHTGEIEQELTGLAHERVTVSFTPHLIPMTRGILVSCYAKLQTSTTKESLEAAYKAFYAEAPFVTIVKDPPATKHTLGSNKVHISLAVDPRTGTVTAFAALDNLGKGMAGQAVQNMNLMLGFPETAGLEVAPLWP